MKGIAFRTAMFVIIMVSLFSVSTASAVPAITNLVTLPGGYASYALSINDKGQVVGWSERQDSYHSFLWQDGVMTDLGMLAGGDSTYAADINDKGQVVGLCWTSTGFSHAFLWEDGVMTALGTLPGGKFSAANGINNRGQVVGYSYTSMNGISAVLWGNLRK